MDMDNMVIASPGKSS